MRRITTAALAVLAVAALAAPAAAQAGAKDKGWISISGGVQPATHDFSDTFTAPVYTETETVNVAYPVKGGTLVAGSVGYRVWKQLAIGVGVTHESHAGSASISASVPHPFFDNQFRSVEGTTSASRTETGLHLLLGCVIPAGTHLRVLITAGPSSISVAQTLVTGINVAETYPYDTATLGTAVKHSASARGIGFNAGADIFWMFSRNIGIGALAQVTQASVKEKIDTGRTVTIDAGGAQVGGGLRFVF